MCMSGGGGSAGGKRLRTGQLATAQRGISTSRVAGYDLQKKGWQNAGEVTTTTRTITKPKTGNGAFNIGRSSEYDQISASLNRLNNPMLNGKAMGMGMQSRSKGPDKPFTKTFGILPTAQTSKDKMGSMGGFSAPVPKPKVGEKRFFGTETYAMDKKTGVITATKTGQERIYEPTQWKARMEKNALQQTQVSDGAQARIKSRSARRGVANVQQNSRFGSKRPKTGSLRIDTSGAQVSG